MTAPGGGGGGSGAAGGGSSGGTASSGGTGAQPPAAPGGSSGASGLGGSSPAGSSGGGSGGGSGATGTGLSLTTLDGPAVPKDAPALFEEAAEANGVAEDGESPGTATARQSTEAAAGSGSDPGPLATVARVVLGAAALGGVPVALAISRRPPRVARQGFPWPQPSGTG